MAKIYYCVLVKYDVQRKAPAEVTAGGMIFTVIGRKNKYA